MKNNKAKIYLAAPLFSIGEMEFNAKIYKHLTNAGFVVFLPQEECKNKQGKDLFQICIKGLEKVDLVVAILDGADADSGTSWECGYAYAKNIPIIGVRTDFRTTGDTQGFNSMLYNSAEIINEQENIFPVLINAIEKIVGE